MIFPCSVKLVGGPGVGKTTLREKFLYPDYVYTYDPGETSHYPSVCIMLENVETELIFIDGDTSELDTQATLVIFSVTDPASLTIAQAKLELDLVESDYTDNAIILVGNKVDLVRTRMVPIHGKFLLLLVTDWSLWRLLTEARAVAIARDCKYVEVSASLGHNVDTLLVGVVKQIRLKLAELAERSSYARWR